MSVTRAHISIVTHVVLLLIDNGSKLFVSFFDSFSIEKMARHNNDDPPPEHMPTPRFRLRFKQTLSRSPTSWRNVSAVSAVAQAGLREHRERILKKEHNKAKKKQKKNKKEMDNQKRELFRMRREDKSWRHFTHRFADEHSLSD